MGMVLFYSLRTTWNQLRKMFRTWIFLIVLCILLGGGLIGFGFARFTQGAQAAQNPEGFVLPENIMEFFDASALSETDAVELGAGLMILSVLSLQVMGAEKSVSRLFLPADVNFLFASDMTPQKVLSFRLFTTLGTAVVASVYLFFQLPSISARFGISGFAAFTVLVSWCMTLAFSILLKILTFEIASRHPFLKNNLRLIVLGGLGVLFFLFYHSYHTSSEQLLLLSAHRFFNAPWTRWIPVWGWLKGMITCSLSGDTETALVLMGLSLALIVILAVLIRVMPVDYYEEAVIRCEELALYMESVNSDNAGLLVTRPMQKSDALERDGFHYGSGASVYFFKTLYNRFRFARFGFLTKTMMTYLFAGIGGGLFVRMFMDEPSIYPPVFLIAAAAFFRTVASPMSEDIRKDSFSLIPENTWLKLIFSLLGGSVSCAMDALIPLMAGAAAAGFFFLKGMVYLPLIVTVDFFATAVGTFVDVAIPPSVDKTFKQVIQILFLYFGMIPDEMIIAFALISGHGDAGIVLASLVNVLLGLLFFALAGVWLDPCPGYPVRSALFEPDLKEAAQAYSRIGGTMALMYAAMVLGQAALTILFSAFGLRGGIAGSLAMCLPMYLFGIPVLIAGSSSMRSERAAPLDLKPFQLLCAFSACLFLMYGGNFLGMIFTGILSQWLNWLPKLPSVLPELSLSVPVQVFFAAVLAPVAEEIIFRGWVIDRLRPYGARTAWIVSSLIFGMFHGNLTQCCYAFLLGLVFGYLYLKTGRLRWSIALHLGINAMGSIIMPGLLRFAMSSLPQKPLYEISLAEALLRPGFLIFLIYLCVVILAALFGAAVTAYVIREKRLSPDTVSLKLALGTPGMMIFLIFLSGVILFAL